MVFSGKESLVSARRSLVLKLRRNSRYVLLVRCCLLFRRGPNRRSTAASIEADPCCIRIYDDGFLIDIGDRNATKIVDRPIVGEDTVVPSAALVSNSAVAEAVIDSAVKADVRSPLSGVPYIDAVPPAPITWCP
jgi:hypothetical protein